LIGRLSVLDNVLIGLLGQRSPWTALLPPSRAERERALDAAQGRALLLQGILERRGLALAQAAAKAEAG